MEETDDFVQGLLARTRERKKVVDDQLKNSDMSMQRKRSQPLAENQDDNRETILKSDAAFREKDSPKRQCFQLDDEPMKSKVVFEAQETPKTPRSRRSKFAALAQEIATWEDDMHKPNIKGPEKPKKVWKPPQPVKDTVAEVPSQKSPKKVWKPPQAVVKETLEEAPVLKSPKKVWKPQQPVKETAAEEAPPLKPPRTYEYESDNKRFISKIEISTKKPESPGKTPRRVELTVESKLAPTILQFEKNKTVTTSIVTSATSTKSTYASSAFTSTSARAPSPKSPVRNETRTTVNLRPVSRSPHREQPITRSPRDKSPFTSPKKVGAAVSAIQERLTAFQQGWQSNEISKKIQQQKQSELEHLKNRWKNGMPQDHDATNDASARARSPSPKKVTESKTPSSNVPSAPPLPPATQNLLRSPGLATKRDHEKNGVNGNTTWTKSPSKAGAVANASWSKSPAKADTQRTPTKFSDLVAKKAADKQKESHRQKMRSEFEEKLQQMGFSVEEGKQASLDLTPYKNQQDQTPTPTKPKVHTDVEVEEKLVTKIVFDQPEHVTKITKHRSGVYEDTSSSRNCASNQSSWASTASTSAVRPAAQSHVSSASSDDFQREYSSEEEDEEEDESESSEEYELDDFEEVLDDETSDESTAEAPQQPVMRRKPNPSFRNARPISQPPTALPPAVTSDEEYYSSVGNRNSAPSSKLPASFRDMQPDAHSTDVDHQESESEHEYGQYLPMTINKYRRSRGALKNAPTPKKTIVKQMEQLKKESHHNAAPQPARLNADAMARRMQELNNLVHQEQNVIMQTSNALNQCCGVNSTFAGSQEAIECHKLLLTSCKKREVYMQEMQRLKEGRVDHVSNQQGSLTISDIRLPLKQDFLHQIGGPNDACTHYFIILLRHHGHIVFTQMMSTHDVLVRGTLEFPNLVKFNDIQQNFHVDVEVYGMSVVRDLGSQTPKKKKGLTPKKGKKAGNPFVHNPAGPTAVRSTNFVLVAHMQLNYSSLNRTHFNLERVPFTSPLQGTIFLRTQCLIENRVEEEGFLTMFEDVSGFGAWHRRWFVLRNNCLMYWKYPEEERCKEPIGVIDLKRVISENVGLIPRDICARPNTFELIYEFKSHGGKSARMNATKLWLACDTKEDRIIWCNKLNEALQNVRTWHSDASQPMHRREMVAPYNPYCPPDSYTERTTEVVPFIPQNRQSAL